MENRVETLRQCSCNRTCKKARSSCETMVIVSVKSRIVIIGGGPGGYESALVAAQLGADVTVIDQDGLGGAAVLTDVVPSKTLIATAEVLATVGSSGELGITGLGKVRADLGVVN